MIGGSTNGYFGILEKWIFFEESEKFSCNSSVSQTLFVPAFSHLENKTKEDQNDSLDNL
jgi:hypothetical protein